MDCQGHLKATEESLQDFHQQMALLKEAEANQSHPLYTLYARYTQYKLVKETQEEAKTALREKMEDCEKHLNLHKVGIFKLSYSPLSHFSLTHTQRNKIYIS